MLGAGVGLTAAVLALGAWAPASVRPKPEATVVVSAAATGELSVAPIPTVLRAGGLRPGSPPAGGPLRVRNQTGDPLSLALRARVEPAALARTTYLELRDGSKTVYWGSVRGLRRPTRPLLTLRSGETRRLRLRTWVVRGARGRWGAGDRALVALDLRTSP